MQYRRNKYRAIKTWCRLGHLHDSLGEAGYCDELALRVRAREIDRYLVQVPYDLKVNGIVICRHVVDFLVTLPDGHNEVHEFKGRQTKDYKIKLKLFAALFPSVPYYLITKKGAILHDPRTNRTRKNRRHPG